MNITITPLVDILEVVITQNFEKADQTPWNNA